LGQEEILNIIIMELVLKQHQNYDFQISPNPALEQKFSQANNLKLAARKNLNKRNQPHLQGNYFITYDINRSAILIISLKLFTNFIFLVLLKIQLRSKPPTEQRIFNFLTLLFLRTEGTLFFLFLLKNFSIPADLNIEQVQSFMNSYRQHCQALVDTVYKHQFPEIEKILHHFWQGIPNQYRQALGSLEIVEFIGEKDQLTYKAMATVLLPNVLQALPVSVPQAIRQFAKQLETWLNSSLDGMPSALGLKKIHGNLPYNFFFSYIFFFLVAKKFAQSLHKQASLNHLTQAARAVLQNSNQVSQMIIDWNSLDFEFIRDQASWICQCGNDLIQSGKKKKIVSYIYRKLAQEDFKKFLTERATLEQWAQWLQDIVNKIIMVRILKLYVIYAKCVSEMSRCARTGAFISTTFIEMVVL
jgi:hypothetical protein